MSVHFATSKTASTSVGPQQIAELITEARSANLRRARICLHPETGDVLHEMIIALCRDSYVAPHRHRRKTESFHMLAGEIDVVVFDDDGRPIALHTLSAENPDLPRVMRLQHPVWHSVLVRTEYAVVHEVTNGPFRKQDTEIATWAADPDDATAVARFRGDMSSWCRKSPAIHEYSLPEKS
jgi:cupin fold WbuC family metalloprotein